MRDVENTVRVFAITQGISIPSGEITIQMVPNDANSIKIQWPAQYSLPVSTCSAIYELIEAQLSK
jgi:hypothetical protein